MGGSRCSVLLPGQPVSIGKTLFQRCSSNRLSPGSWRGRIIGHQQRDGLLNLRRPHHTEVALKPKCYVLSMFPYPSGTLHMGHLRVYTISDVLARYKRMTGHDVLHPMGWDAFGLPAENAALERGVDPGDWTLSNIGKMKVQLLGMGSEFDWDKEFMTCAPSFYKHTQRIFLMLYERGLAYQAEAMVNYDPIDKTVLANEQVDQNGCSWRSGAKVEKIMLRQWFLKITAFQDALLEGINSLLEKGTWPERVLTQQKHWLGKSEGAKIKFEVAGNDLEQTKIEVFTTRPDTLFGVQFLALSLNHPIVQKVAQHDENLQEFIKSAANLPPESKVGYRLPGIYASNPIQDIHGPGSENQVPIFTAPYVLGDYGEGAVMGVPGHDSRDWAFWAQNGQGVEARIVITPANENTIISKNETSAASGPFTSRGVLASTCGEYAGMDSATGAKLMVARLGETGAAEVAQNWRLRDWLISRQRYWGTPIPIIHCDSCGAVPVPVEDLPVELPDLAQLPAGVTGNPLEHIESWKNTSCPKCHGPAKRDTDTMDTFVDSSWYYMRFPDAKNEDQPFSLVSAKNDLPVDMYIGGVEHAILHLLYARFIYKFLVSEGLVPKASENDQGLIEPFRQVISQGMVHGKTFSDPATGRFLLPSEVEFTENGSPIMKSSGVKPNISFEKMSKSKHNGVDPSTCIAKYGADETRAHILFSAPVSEVLEWDESKIVGVQRWFSRVTRLVDDCIQANGGKPTLPETLSINTEESSALSDEDIQNLLAINDAILSVTRTFEHNIYALNTTVSDLIKLTNQLLAYDISKASQNLQTSTEIKLHGLSVLLRMLNPIAPTFTQQCWTKLNPTTGQISSLPFPTPLLSTDQTQSLLSRRKTFTCAVQINGKLRFNADIPSFTLSDPEGSTNKQEQEQEHILSHLLETEEGKNWLTVKHDLSKRKRMIVVRGGKVVNFVF